MKLVWDDVCDIFDDVSLWENGHDMYWYRLMWGLMEYRNMNVYITETDRVKVLSRAFAIIKIYKEFISRCFDDEEINEVFDAVSSSVFGYLYNDDDVRDIFRALHEELGAVRTFYSMFITCIEFRDGQISYVEENDEDEECDDEEWSEPECFEDDFDYYPEDDSDEDEDEENIFENCAEDYYYSFESYLKVLATSSMSLVNDFTPEKIAGYMYIARNMNI